jgi:DNA-binding transcriptional regulator YiaG
MTFQSCPKHQIRLICHLIRRGFVAFSMRLKLGIPVIARDGPAHAHSPMISENHSHRYSSGIALGIRLKDWRLRESLKISVVAAQLGVSTATWGHWETGEHLPSGDLLLALEQLTGMPLCVLFCPHIDSCPQLKNDHKPVAYRRCCQLAGGVTGQDDDS